MMPTSLRGNATGSSTRWVRPSGYGSLELVRDAAVGGPGQPVVGKHQPRAVAAQTLECLALVGGYYHAGVQREAGAPGAQPIAGRAPRGR